jgi:hypothetical protein
LEYSLKPILATTPDDFNTTAMTPIQLSRLSQRDRIIFFAIAATLVGLIVRLTLPLTASFPLNDGGLFYTMIRDIQQNNYKLPVFTSYNHASIPFAYPPLALYLAGFITDFLHLDLLTFLRIVPPVASAAAIPIFYFLSLELLQSETMAALAALIFALTPRIFEWQIMGGGITRSFGFLFCLLTLYNLQRLYTSRANRFMVWTSIFGALVILSHPEAIPQTAFAALIIYLITDRARGGLIRSLIISGIALLLSSPWWITVLIAHGFAPFAAALSAARQDTPSAFLRLYFIVQFELTSEPYLPFIAIFAMIGFFQNIGHKKYLFPVWMLATYLIEPRSGSLYMMIPLSILAAEGLDQILKILAQNHNLVQAGSWFRSRTAQWFFGFIVLYLIAGAYADEYMIFTQYSLTKSQVRAMTWIRTNTPPDSQIIVVSNLNALADPVSDWFPALTDRTSQATVFGYEWVNDNRFEERIQKYKALQNCINQDETCLNTWTQQYEITYQYIFITHPLSDVPPLGRDLLQSGYYKTAYQTTDALLLERVP